MPQAPVSTDNLTFKFSDECRDTSQACYRAAMHCIESGRPLNDPDRVRILLDCADTAALMAAGLNRSSAFQRPMGRLLMVVARACGHAIEDVDHDDPHLRSAYVLCQRIRISCSEHLGEADAAAYDEQDLTVQGTFPASDAPPTGPEN
jgi:hypothetical protein